VQIPKPGTAETRPLGIPTVRDRVVQAEVEGFAYFQHSRRVLLQQVDCWVRQRLRGILRKRRKGRGRAGGDDLKRWGLAFSPDRGCIVWKRPMSRPVNPYEGETIDWRAGCGKSASPVRREGRPRPMRRPYPYPIPITVLLIHSNDGLHSCRSTRLPNWQKFRERSVTELVCQAGSKSDSECGICRILFFEKSL